MMMMMKQQDALRSSSYRRESSPTPENMHAKKIGCMSAILRLVSKQQNRRRFITFGKKQGKSSSLAPSPTKQKEASPSSSSSPQQQTINKDEDLQKLAGNVPRSPTLSADIRRATDPLKIPEKLPPSTALVTRLMGLEDDPGTVAEKRQILLGALQKCDEDLKTLKKMIEAVNSVSDQKGNNQLVQATPSPVSVSVLDDYFKNCSAMTGRNVQQQKKKKAGGEKGTNPSFIERITTPEMIQESWETMKREVESPLWISKAMVESVNEVCRDVSWGEKREQGRIGLALQDCICRDLIEEVVTYLSPPPPPPSSSSLSGSCSSASFLSSSSSQQLPFESCKRRLRF
ncbi:hypothetical protein K2173_014998 [Erythroxylum novogranatense]|uniref:DUF4378 domain-containing protein n=1 Tax=Erythroxylum novogranatense TaxID=1862640 RepID=A0AAV8TWV6_9ROSI|nr:hypothetical protein K2173_014998 [Erythroxylum novogranatense]